MDVQMRARKEPYVGQDVVPGDTFTVPPKGTTVYLALDNSNKGHGCFAASEEEVWARTCGVYAVALHSGRVYGFPVQTSRRIGFRLVEPEDGPVTFVRKRNG